MMILDICADSFVVGQVLTLLGLLVLFFTLKTMKRWQRIGFISSILGILMILGSCIYIVNFFVGYCILIFGVFVLIFTAKSFLSEMKRWQKIVFISSILVQLVLFVVFHVSGLLMLG